MESTMIISDRLAELRRRLRVDNAGLAAALNVSFYAVDAWCKSTRNPSRLALAAIERLEAETDGMDKPTVTPR